MSSTVKNPDEAKKMLAGAPYRKGGRNNNNNNNTAARCQQTQQQKTPTTSKQSFTGELEALSSAIFDCSDSCSCEQFETTMKRIVN